MTLLEFIIKIVLRSGTAVQQLQKLNTASARAKAGLNSVGKAAAAADKKVGRAGKTAAKSQGLFTKLARSVRIGGGMRVGSVAGVGAQFAPNAVLGALGALPTPLIALAAAAGAAAVAVGALADLDKKRAAAVIGMSTTSVPATRVQLAQLAAQQRAGLTMRGSRGQNILGSVGMADIAQMQGELLKAGISITDVLKGDLLNALGALRVADPEVPIENLITAIANAGPVATATGGSITDAAYSLSALASGTKFSMKEVSTAIATVAPQAKSMGVSISTLTQLMLLGEEGFSSAAKEATGLRSVLSKLNITPKTKQVTLDEAKYGIDYTKDGKAKDLFDVRAMLLDVQSKMTPTEFERYLTQRFMKEGKQFWLAFLAQTPEAVKTAKAQAGRGEQAATIAAEISSETSSARVSELKNKFLSFLEGLRDAGLGTLFNFIVDGIIALLDALTVAVNMIGHVTRPIIDVIDGVIRTVFEFIEWIGKKVWNLLPAGVQKTLRELASNAKGLGAAVSNQKAETPAEKLAAVSAANSEAKSAADNQKQVLAAATEVNQVAETAKNNAKQFAPLVKAAQAFRDAMVLWTRAARLGVQAELLQMVAMVYKMASQFELAGRAVGASFNLGLQSGFAGIGAGTTVVNNNNQRYAGVTPQVLDKHVKRSIEGSRRTTTDRREGRR